MVAYRNYEEPDDPAKTTHSKMTFVSRPSSFCDCAQTSKRKTPKETHEMRVDL